MRPFWFAAAVVICGCMAESAEEAEFRRNSVSPGESIQVGQFRISDFVISRDGRRVCVEAKFENCSDEKAVPACHVFDGHDEEGAKIFSSDVPLPENMGNQYVSLAPGESVRAKIFVAAKRQNAQTAVLKIISGNREPKANWSLRFSIPN